MSQTKVKLRAHCSRGPRRRSVKEKLKDKVVKTFLRACKKRYRKGIPSNERSNYGMRNFTDIQNRCNSSSNSSLYSVLLCVSSETRLATSDFDALSVTSKDSILRLTKCAKINNFNEDELVHELHRCSSARNHKLNHKLSLEYEDKQCFENKECFNDENSPEDADDLEYPEDGLVYELHRRLSARSYKLNHKLSLENEDKQCYKNEEYSNNENYHEDECPENKEHCDNDKCSEEYYDINKYTNDKESFEGARKVKDFLKTLNVKHQHNCQKYQGQKRNASVAGSGDFKIFQSERRRRSSSPKCNSTVVNDDTVSVKRDYTEKAIGGSKTKISSQNVSIHKCGYQNKGNTYVESPEVADLEFQCSGQEFLEEEHDKATERKRIRFDNEVSEMPRRLSSISALWAETGNEKEQQCGYLVSRYCDSIKTDSELLSQTEAVESNSFASTPADIERLSQTEAVESNSFASIPADSKPLSQKEAVKCKSFASIPELKKFKRLTITTSVHFPDYRNQGHTWYSRIMRQCRIPFYPQVSRCSSLLSTDICMKDLSADISMDVDGKRL